MRNEQANEMLEAQRKKNLGIFRPNAVLDAKLKASTPRKAMTEEVTVEFTPSLLTDAFVDSWFNQVSRVFRGDMRDVRPVLAYNVTNEPDVDVEKQLFTQYLETIFWRKMASVNRDYAKGYQDLARTIDDAVFAPALFTNAVNCVGIVTIHNLALRLVPAYSDDYDWKNRILSKEKFVQVAEWIRELTDWGFQAYDGFNHSREGNLDFMLMSVVEESAVEEVAAPVTLEEGKVAESGTGRKCKFVIKSQRAASNIVALYRYFFHNKKVEYLSDTRLTYSYSDFESTCDAVHYIMSMMIWENNVPTYLEIDKKGSDKEVEIETSAEESK